MFIFNKSSHFVQVNVTGLRLNIKCRPSCCGIRGLYRMIYLHNTPANNFCPAWLHLSLMSLLRRSLLSPVEVSKRKICYLWRQTHYLLINIAFPPFLLLREEKSPCFILRFPILHAMLYGKHRRDRMWWTNAFHLGKNAFAGAGQQWPWEYSEATVGLSLLWKWSQSVGLIHSSSHTFSPSTQKAEQPARAIAWHISIQFPLQNVFIFGLMACHSAGAFGQELILESKQIFRRAIFHQVLIFLHSRSLYSLI